MMSLGPFNFNPLNPYLDTAPASAAEPAVERPARAHWPSMLKVHMKGRLAWSEVERLLEQVAGRFGVTTAKIMAPNPGRRRGTRRLSNARHVICWVLTRHGMGREEVGEMLAGLDHSTVVYAVKKIERERAADPELAEWLDGLVGDQEAR